MDLNVIILTQGLVAWVVVVFTMWRGFPRPSKLTCLIGALLGLAVGICALLFLPHGFILSAMFSAYCWGSWLQYVVDERNKARTEQFLNA